MNDKRKQAELLAAIAEEQKAELFRSPDGETTYATVPVGRHYETWPIRSKGFKRWLVYHFFRREGKPPGHQALADALGLLEAWAQFGGAVYPVSVRVAGSGGAIYIDLGDAEWRGVEITATGWDITANLPVKFRRPRGIQPLPVPVGGGSLDAVREFLNLADDDQWRLLAGALVGALRPDEPHAVLTLQGEQDSGKSTAAKILRRLIDPNTADLRTKPRDERDLIIAANNGWLISIDNVSFLDLWLSDALCRLTTGAGFGTRELYENMDEILFEGMRPITLNGIEQFVVRGDLLDRTLLLDLPSLQEGRRRPATEFWQAFWVAQPRILGALYSAVSCAIRRRDSVQLDSLPRLADLAIFVTAAAPALGWPELAFVEAYTENRANASNVAIEASAVALALRDLAGDGEWNGTATDLLAKLTTLVSDTTRKEKGWPKSAQALSGAIRRLAPNLRKLGIGITFEREGKDRKRLVRVKKIEEEERRPPGPPDQAATTADANAQTPSAANLARNKGSDRADAMDAKIAAQSHSEHPADAMVAAPDADEDSVPRWVQGDIEEVPL